MENMSLGIIMQNRYVEYANTWITGIGTRQSDSPV